VDRLIAFFLKNPILLIVVVVWLLGIVGNIAKAAKKAKERAEAAARRGQRDEPIGTGPASLPGPAPAREPEPVRSADEIAREMRRILGIEPKETDARRGDSAPTEMPSHREDAVREASVGETARTEVPPAPPRRQRNVAEPERAPVPVAPTTASRRLTIHVDPHVGEGIQKRGTVTSGRVGEHAGHELGTLGGRVQQAGRRSGVSSRYALDDLKRALVLSEILGPPLALRSGERQV